MDGLDKNVPLPGDEARIAVIGLGYVGLPLAVEFGKQRAVLGFDLNAARVDEVNRGHDRTRELTGDELAAATGLVCSPDADELASCDVFIVTVPTPIDAFKRPDLSPLVGASRTVGAALRRGAVVVFESTVYPGCTEEVCAPILEAESGLKVNVDFSLGYSPERINPGDKLHRLPTICKVTSGSNPGAADYIDALYGQIIQAGTHKASSIRVAEAAKVIENTQRDVNIALINELSVLFDRCGIDTTEVLEAAGTKWNFLPFRPGLVGGHCIGVDPYYLTHKAQQLGHHPEMILAGRRINDSMGQVIIDRVVRLMAARGLMARGARVLVLGYTFKENCPDVRNTRVIDMVRALQAYGLTVDIHDPCADREEVRDATQMEPLDSFPDDGDYSAIVLAVAHEEFTTMGAAAIRKAGRDGCVLFDVKSALARDESDARL